MSRKNEHTGPCAVMHECGGCTSINRPYKKQLAAKQAQMEELFGPLCQAAGIAVSPIRGMDASFGDPGKYPAPRAFRYKAATPFAPGENGRVRCGFFVAGSHRIIPIEACAVEAPGARQILNGIAPVAERLGVSAYNEDTYKGLLRYAVLRLGWKSNEGMLTVVTSQPSLPHADEFFDALAALSPRVTTVAHNVNTRVTNAILGPETHVVRGAAYMHDELLGCTFAISPTAFYQTNPQQTELLYQLAIDGMQLKSGQTLLDAYCGSGTIGICAAKQAQAADAQVKLLGVEKNPAGIRDAQRNAQLNGLESACDFVAEDATAYMRRAASEGRHIDVLSIDPPRAGSTPEFLAAAATLAPRRIVYISCNPTTQERDLQQLTASGYRLKNITPVDMFPHSAHTETVAVLSLR